MPDQVTLHVEGLAELARGFEEWSREVQQGVMADLEAMAPGLQAELQQAAPIAADAHHGHPPGNLRRGIRVMVQRDVGAASLRVRASALHSHLVEFGTVKWRGQPFFVQTVRNARSAFRHRIVSRLERPAAQIGDGSPDVVDTGD